MTPNFFLINASSLALICLMIFFARHNRRSGWIKQRATFVEDLIHLQKEWDLIDQEIARAATAAAQPEAAKPVPMPTAPVEIGLAETSAFTFQLASLQAALGRSAPVTITETVEEREAVTK